MLRTSKAIGLLSLALATAALPEMAATVTFVKTDTVTSGTWKGTYGQDGAIIADNPTPGPLNHPVIPGYATVNITSGNYVWSDNGTPPPPIGQSMLTATQKTNSTTERIAAAFYKNDSADKTVTVDVNITDGQTHKIALYALDWDRQSRQERIDVLEFGTNAVLSTTTVQNFQSGVYSVWDIQGHVIFRVTGLTDAGSALSGIFFGANVAVPVGNSATFVKVDSPTPAGDWKATYGQDGHIIPAEPNNVIPAYVTVLGTKQGGGAPTPYSYTDTPTDATDPRAMQWFSTPPASIVQGNFVINNPARNPSVFYDPTSITYDINFIDGQNHQVAIYALDFDSFTRTETITVLDGDTNAVLNTQTVSNFHAGKYFVWVMSGHIKIRFDNTSPTSNLEFSGLYFGGATSGVGCPAVLTTPTPSSTLAGSQATFAWNSCATAQAYWLDVGTALGQGDIFGANVGSALSQAVSNIPTNGQTIYVQLWSQISNTWTANRYTYTAASGGGSTCPAVLATPAPSSTLTGAQATFTWNACGTATAYWLDVGTVLDQGNIFGQNVGSATSQTVTNIPLNGQPIYVKLWSQINGNWNFNRYTYTAASGGGSTCPAVLATPAPSSTLTGAQATFTWNACGTATAYWLDVGTVLDLGNIFGQNVGSATSQTVTNIPLNGQPIYVKLWSQINGNWNFNRYTYTAASGGGSTCPAVLSTPAPSSTLTGAQATFTWNACGTATAYWLDVGTVLDLGNIFGQNVGSATSQTVTNIPLNGQPIYVKLWSQINGNWNFNRYTYTAAPVQTVCPAVLATPAPSSTLTGAQATFTWNACGTATAYWLDVGTALGQGNIFGQNVGSATSQTVTNIPAAGQTIYVQLWSQINGNWNVNRYTYTAAAGAPPTITIVSPAGGSSVGGSVGIQVSTTSTIGVASVQFKLDGNNIGSPVTAGGPTYSFNWDASTVSNTTHVLTAVVTDLQGQIVTSAPVNITVTAPPTVTITAPTAGSTVSDTIALSATATSSNAAIASVQFRVDGNVVGTGVAGSNNTFTLQWNSGSVSSALHAITAVAKDNNGSSGTSSPVNITTNNKVTPSASFVKLDTDTRGNWKGVYGADGWIIANDTDNKIPAYATVTLPGVNGPTFTYTTLNLSPNALQKGAANATDRIASAFYTSINATPFSFDITINDTSTHELALYLWDVESGRSETITILNGDTNAVLATKALSNFGSAGTYAVFNVTGHVIVRVTYNGGINAILSGLFFKTLGPPPAVSVTTPTSGANLTGSVSLSATATATAPATLTSLQFFLDGSAVSAALSGAGPSFSTQWDSSGVLNGQHVLTAVATDSTGRTGTSASVNVSTTNTITQPVISITNPGATTVSGVINVTANAVSPVGIASVQFKLDGTNLGAPQTNAQPPYSVSWDTRTASNGSHNLTAVATDKQGVPMSTTSATVNVTVQNAVSSASFVKTDVDTKGNWKGVYGTDGWIIANDTNNTIPSYATVTLPGAAGPTYTWTTLGGSPNALQKGAANATDRIASAFATPSNGTQFTFDVNISDANGHELAVYTWDPDIGTRSETITILNGDTNVVLATKSLSSFTTGTYAVFNVTGHIIVRVTATSAANAVLSGLFFKTLGPPPAVSVTTPTSGANLTGSVTLSATATATAPATLTSLQFLVDGNAISAALSGAGPSFSTQWNSSGVLNGQHVLTAVATDSTGRTGNASVNVSTTNTITQPVISITSPGSTTVSGVINVTANAVSPAGIASVQFKLDGGNLGSPQTNAQPPYSVSWDTRTASNGSHNLTAVATDKQGVPMSTTSATVNVTVQNTAPSAKFIKTDSVTKGSWKGVYGADGYLIPGDSNSPPGYVTITGPTGGTLFDYHANPADTDPRLVQKGTSDTGRVLGAFVTGPAVGNFFTFEMTFTDSAPHELALYLFDYENFSRSETITILNGDTNVVLATQLMSNFGDGTYAVVQVSGHIVMRVTVNGGNGGAVINGLFFATPPPPPPAPIVNIVTPGAGAALSGLAALTASASANAPATIKSVQFKLDGVAIGAQLTGGPSYTMAWDSRGAINGAHSITAVATDSFDQTTTSTPVQVATSNVDGPPIITMTAPAAGMLTGIVTVTANATSARGIANVQFKLDGNNLGAIQTAGSGSSYSITWDTSGLSGAHFLTAVATDTAAPARTTESARLNVTVANPNPTGAFVRVDTTTLGNWKGIYGADGHIIPDDSSELPASTSVSIPANASLYTWNSNTWNDQRSLLRGNSDTLRIASTYTTTTSFTLDLSFSDVNRHELALYLWDLDGGGARAEIISILNANTNAVLATKTMTGFAGSAYVIFNISGHVLLKVANTGTPNALLNGIFFKTLEAPPPPPPPPSVSVTSPASGAAITGVTTLTATAIANSPSTMVSVQFRLDGNAIGAPVLSAGPNFSMQWNSALAVNGSHTLTAVANDSAAQSTLSGAVNISTNNTVAVPSVTITEPVSGNVSGLVTISAAATSTAGIASVQFKLDGSNLGAAVTGGGPTYAIQWPTGSLTGLHTLTAVATDLQPVPQSAESAPVSITIGSATTSAIFVKSDTVTKGNWKGVYGADGFIIPNDSNLPPGYATVSVNGGTPYTWNISSGDVRALQKGSDVVTERIASTYYSSANSFSVDVNMTDGQLHQLALYMVDLDTTTRKQTVQLLNADTNDLLATQQVPSFSNGLYLVFNVRGHILVKISNAGGAPNILLTGMFFRSFTGLTPPAVDITNPTGGFLTGPVTLAANATSAQGIYSVQIQLNGQNIGVPMTGAGPNYSQMWATPGVPDGNYTFTAVATDALGLVSTSPGYSVSIANGSPVAPAATFVKRDITTSGSWVGTYGADGFIIPNGISNLPYYLTLDLNGATTFTWNGQDTNPNQAPGLQKSPSDLEHLGTTFEVTYGGTGVRQPLLVDLNFIDNQTHQAAFYLIDWHHTERIETVEVLNADTGAVLDSQILNPVGPGGTYLVYNLRGHVKLRILQINNSTNLSSVASGMFFAPVQ